MAQSVSLVLKFPSKGGCADVERDLFTFLIVKCFKDIKENILFVSHSLVIASRVNQMYNSSLFGPHINNWWTHTHTHIHTLGSVAQEVEQVVGGRSSAPPVHMLKCPWARNCRLGCTGCDSCVADLLLLACICCSHRAFLLRVTRLNKNN